MEFRREQGLGRVDRVDELIAALKDGGNPESPTKRPHRVSNLVWQNDLPGPRKPLNAGSTSLVGTSKLRACLWTLLAAPLAFASCRTV